MRSSALMSSSVVTSDLPFMFSFHRLPCFVVKARFICLLSATFHFRFTLFVVLIVRLAPGMAKHRALRAILHTWIYLRHRLTSCIFFSCNAPPGIHAGVPCQSNSSTYCHAGRCNHGSLCGDVLRLLRCLSALPDLDHTSLRSSFSPSLSVPQIVTHTLGISDDHRLQIFAFTICASSL